MDALGELVAGALELVVEVLPLRVSAAIAANVAVMYFAIDWVVKHETSPPWDGSCAAGGSRSPSRALPSCSGSVIAVERGRNGPRRGRAASR